MNGHKNTVTVRARIFPLIMMALVLLVWAATVSAQAVFVGIPGSRCESSTALADSKNPEWLVNSKQYWASGFLDGAHAGLGMAPVRSSVNFTYSRLQNYCGQHPSVTLQDAMLALVAEDRPTSAANTTSATSGPPQVVFRAPVFRLNPPTWVLWAYSSGGWEVVTSDAVDLSSKAPVNLAYFETSADCATVRGWLAGLPKADAVKSLSVSFQCYPSSFDPRTKK